jgi:hypothetical protein
MEWWQKPPIIEDHDGIAVVREDLLDGGSKIRFLPYLVEGAREIVYGSPFCGGAGWALSVWGRRMGVPVTLFYAKRKDLHWRQKAAFLNGATIYQVPAGRMTVVQHRARSYAADRGALFLPLGFDLPQASGPFVAVMRRVAADRREIREVWCATGSGMLARCLGQAFPSARVFGVIVGLRSRNAAQKFPPNVTLLDCRYDFAERCESPAPFNACAHYEGKAWELLKQRSNASPPGTILFWSVAGDRQP